MNALGQRRAGAVLLLGAGLIWSTAALAQPAEAPPQRWALSVAGRDLPERDAWLPTAAELLLFRALRSASGAALIPPDRLADARREVAGSGGAELSTESLAAALGATHVLEVTLRGTPDALEVSAARIALADPARAPVTAIAGRFPGALIDLADVLAPHDAGAPRRPGHPPDSAPSSAWEYLARAIDAERNGDVLTAVHFAKLAGDRSPDFRPALLRLTDLELRFNPQRTRPLAAARLALVAELARAADDPHDALTAELGLAKLARASGDAAAALERAARAVAAADALREPYLNLAALSTMCDLTLADAARPGLPEPLRGDAARRAAREARPWQRLVLAELEALGDRIGAGGAAAKLAVLHEQAGDLVAALEWAERARDAAKALQLPRAEAAAWMQIAQIHRRRLDGAAAVAAMQRVIDLAPDTDKPAARVALAEAHLLTQDAAAAIAAYRAAHEQLQREQRELSLQLTCLRELGTLIEAQGRRDEALAWLRRAIDVAHALRSADETTLRQRVERLERPAP
jgi:tetratricopeptide (TPR) repeat protein